MAITKIHLKVFLASPSDVNDERLAMEDVIKEVNQTLGQHKGIHLDLVKWETHSRPGIGADAQDVINKQISNSNDIFIGIMWGKFGSPTNRAESGTEEEFNQAYLQYKTNPDSIQIMFYFKDTGIPISEMNLDQIGKVKNFKDKISKLNGCFYHEFMTTENFQSKVRIHLSQIVQDWVVANPKESIDKMPNKAEPNKKTIDPLANLKAISEVEIEYEVGLIELAEKASESLTLVSSIVERITEATIELGDKFQLRSKEANAIKSKDEKVNFNASKKVANDAGHDIEDFVNKLSVEIPLFHKQHLLAMDSYSRIAMISKTDLEVDLEENKMLLMNIQEYSNSISTSAVSLVEFRNTISSLTRMTSIFNNSKRRAVAVIDDLIVQLNNARNQTEDVMVLLKQLGS